MLFRTTHTGCLASQSLYSTTTYLSTGFLENPISLCAYGARKIGSVRSSGIHLYSSLRFASLPYVAPERTSTPGMGCPARTGEETKSRLASRTSPENHFFAAGSTLSTTFSSPVSVSTRAHCEYTLSILRKRYIVTVNATVCLTSFRKASRRTHVDN